MPTGVYVRTESYRNKMRNSMIGNTNARNGKGIPKTKRTKEHITNHAKVMIGKTAGVKNGNYQFDKYRYEGGPSPIYWIGKLGNECYLCKSKDIQLHHKDHNRKNNKRENVCLICKVCHYFWHGYFESGILKELS